MGHDKICFSVKFALFLIVYTLKLIFSVEKSSPPRSSLQTVVYTPSDMIPSSCLFISFRTCFALSCICPLCSNVYRDTILLYADHGPEEMINPPAVYTITMRNAFTAFIYDMLIVLAFLPQGLFFKVFQCFWRRNSRVHIN